MPRFLLTALILVNLALAQHAPLGKGQIVILVGPPGSGKSVQSKSLSKKYKIPAVSLAELLHVSGSLGEGSKASVASGELLSDESAVQILAARVVQPDCGKGFILDGFPANSVQAGYLDSFVKKNNFPTPKVVVLDAPDEVVRARLLKRKRADDTPANVNRRLKEYRQEVAFLEGWYKPGNTVRVDATKTPQEVFAAVEEGLAESFTKKGFGSREATK